MRVNWLLVGGVAAAAVGLYLYTHKQGAGVLASGAAGGQQSLVASQSGATVNMKVGDNLSVQIPGANGAPQTSGPSVFGGSEAVLTYGAANAVATGTETLTWPGGATLTVVVS